MLLRGQGKTKITHWICQYEGNLILAKGNLSKYNLKKKSQSWSQRLYMYKSDTSFKIAVNISLKELFPPKKKKKVLDDKKACIIVLVFSLLMAHEMMSILQSWI